MSRTLSLCVLLLTVLTAASVLADVISVPGDYDYIHDAVQAAVAGDIVEVAAGTYTDCTHTVGTDTTKVCVVMKSGVTLRGAGSAETIIDAEGLGRGIFLEYVEDCRIENLQVRHAFAKVYGSGILMRHVGRDVEITDVLVTLCTDGGVICYNEASPTLLRVDCVANSSKQGGGMAIEENSNPWVLDCLIDANEAPSGAGIFIRNDSNAYLSRCTITNNVINANWGQGGGLFIGDSSPTIVRCDISGNSALGNGGGVAYQLGAAGTMSGCTITGNTLDNNYVYGGGVAVDSSAPLIDGCIITGNRCVAPYSDAPGVHMLFDPAPTLRNCTIADNEGSAAGCLGAGVFVMDVCTPTLEKCIIAYNTDGPGIFCESEGSMPTVMCCDVFGNDGGDAICGTDGGGNFSLAPLFCGVGDYLLQTGSPCATGCAGALIGALPANCGATDAQDAPRLSAHLVGNYPNPFNPSTTIVFRLDAPGAADVRIFDVAGRTMTTFTWSDLPAGRHEAVWDGRTADGQQAASGVYFYELNALNTQQSRRMILVK